MPSIRDSILADIHAKKIQPRPRWQYILLHAGLWTSGIVTIVLGSFACALMILEFSLPERAYFRWMEMNASPWFAALPYLWGIGMIAVLTIGYFIFSKTGRSYRFHAGAIVVLLIVWSFVGGEITYISGFAQRGDHMIQRFQPSYREFREGFQHMIPRPEEGILPLLVTQIEWEEIQGNGPDGQEWQVILKCGTDACLKRQALILLHRPAIFEGKIREEHVFDAFEVLFPGEDLHVKIRKNIPPRGATVFH